MKRKKVETNNSGRSLEFWNKDSATLLLVY